MSRNYAEEGRARLEALRALDAEAEAAGLKAFEGLQVISGMTLDEEEKASYLIGFKAGYVRGKASERSGS